MNYFICWYDAGLERYEQEVICWEFCPFSNGVNLELHAIFNAKCHLQSSNGHQGTSILRWESKYKGLHHVKGPRSMWNHKIQYLRRLAVMTQSRSEALNKQDFLFIGRNVWFSQQISLNSKIKIRMGNTQFFLSWLNAGLEYHKEDEEEVKKTGQCTNALRISNV